MTPTQKIIATVGANPGITSSDLQRVTGYKYATTRAAQLARQGVLIRRQRRPSRYYVSDAHRREAEELRREHWREHRRHTRQPLPDVLNAIRSEPGISVAGVADRLGGDFIGTQHAVDRLCAMGLVVIDDGGVRLGPQHPPMLTDGWLDALEVLGPDLSVEEWAHRMRVPVPHVRHAIEFIGARLAREAA